MSNLTQNYEIILKEFYGGGMSGGGAPSPIKLRPVDDIEEQINRKQ